MITKDFAAVLYHVKYDVQSDRKRRLAMFIVIHTGYDCVMLVKIVIHARSDMGVLIVDPLKPSTASTALVLCCFVSVQLDHN